MKYVVILVFDVRAFIEGLVCHEFGVTMCFLVFRLKKAMKM